MTTSNRRTRTNRKRGMTRVTDPDIARALGRIEGKLDGLQSSQQEQNTLIGKMDERLRHVERRSAVHGATAGLFAGTGVTIIVEYLRRSVGL